MLGERGRGFETHLHPTKSSEADELDLVVVFGQEAWPPASGHLRSAGQLLVSCYLLISCDRGPGK